MYILISLVIIFLAVWCYTDIEESRKEERLALIREDWASPEAVAKRAADIAKWQATKAKWAAELAAREAVQAAETKRQAAKDANRVPWSFDAKMILAASPVGLLMLLCVLVRMGS
jgi:hypothetical protein